MHVFHQVITYLTTLWRPKWRLVFIVTGTQDLFVSRRQKQPTTTTIWRRVLSVHSSGKRTHNFSYWIHVICQAPPPPPPHIHTLNSCIVCLWTKLLTTLSVMCHKYMTICIIDLHVTLWFVSISSLSFWPPVNRLLKLPLSLFKHDTLGYWNKI